MKTATELESYKSTYGLAGQLDFLLDMNHHRCFSGLKVLEIGGSNIPKGFIFEVLRAQQWISVDRVYPQNRELWPKQYHEAEVLPLTANVEYASLGKHEILDGGIEDVGASFAEKFDLVVSMDAFEHILKFATMLRRAFDALKSGGLLLSMYSPIWSCHYGHHLWGITDRSGRTFNMTASPVPMWGHLLMRPHEMYKYLLAHTDPETADEIVSQIYHCEHVNRFHHEDFKAYFEHSMFKEFALTDFVARVEPDDQTQCRLELLHPGYRNFSSISIKAIAAKR